MLRNRGPLSETTTSYKDLYLQMTITQPPQTIFIGQESGILQTHANKNISCDGSMEKKKKKKPREREGKRPKLKIKCQIKSKVIW